MKNNLNKKILNKKIIIKKNKKNILKKYKKFTENIRPLGVANGLRCCCCDTSHKNTNNSPSIDLYGAPKNKLQTEFYKIFGS